MNKKLFLLAVLVYSCVNVNAQNKPLQVSGIYPHLATFNEGWPKEERIGRRGGQGFENGIGAMMPWVGDYVWNKGETTKILDVNQNVGQYTYTVTDNVGGTSYLLDPIMLRWYLQELYL